MGNITNIKLTPEKYANHQPEQLVISTLCNRMRKLIIKKIKTFELRNENISRSKLLNQNYDFINRMCILTAFESNI